MARTSFARIAKRGAGLAVLWLVVALGLAHRPVHAAVDSPLARVRTTVDAVIAALREPNLERDRRWERIATAVGENFDFPGMSRSVLSSSWQRATQEERRRFTEYFSQYIEVTFRSRIESYDDQRIEYLGERVTGDRAVVDTAVVSERVRTPVTYRLHRSENGPRAGQWLAYDVVIEGVSLVANYRNTFAAIEKSEGMDGLLADVQRRIEKHRAARP